MEATEGISVPYTLNGREFGFYNSVNNSSDILEVKIRPAYARRF